MPVNYNDAFKDIPGTVVFDATQSRLGYHLNMFCMSLMKAENRAAFKADPALGERFASLSFTRRRELAEPISDAKRPETRARRLEDALKRLRTQ